MSLNCNEINAVLSELDISYSFIQEIIQPGFDSLALYLYGKNQPKTVLICLAPGATRIHETRRKIPKNDKPLRFMEFLRSRIRGYRINSCEQIGYERVIKMNISTWKETLFIYIRLWSAAPNIIVTDENNLILDVFYRRPKKNEVTGGTFIPPEVSEPLPAPDTERFPVRTFSELDETPAFIKAREAGREPTYSERIDTWYAEHAEALSRESLLEQAEKWYTSKHSKMEGALKKLEAKRESFLASDKLKHQGDLILTYGHLIDGASNFLECEDYETGAQVRILIDPKKNAQENAAVYYDKYKKSVSGLDALEHDISRAKKELLDLEAAYEAVKKEPNPLRMQQMIRKQVKPKQQIVKKRPGISYEIKGWTLLIGRDADENDELLRHHVRGADLWLHTRDFPGGYVFIKARPGKSVPPEVLKDAGNLAIYYSKARKARTADLYCTQVKYLRRAKNGPKGTVLPTNEKNLTYTLDENRLRELDEFQTDV